VERSLLNVPARMAHLNLRDRVIEATIAYVGAHARGGAENLAHVRRDPKGGRAGALEERVSEGGTRVLALEWRPRDRAGLNDCEIAVKLVAAEAPADPEGVRQVLVDADGLVLMLDADPEAALENQRVVETVKDALGRAPERRVPVVVQWNQVEGAAGDDSADALGTGEWPRVPACLPKGDGVMETLQRAVDVVVETMQTPTAAPNAGAPRALAGLRVEGNPLLAALRQILQAAVRDEIAALEGRLVERFERSITTQPIADQVGSLEATVERLDSALTELGERYGAQITRLALSEEVVRLEQKVASREDLARLEQKVIADGGRHTQALADRLAAFEAWAANLESVLVDATNRAIAASGRASTKEDVERSAGRFAAELAKQHEAALAEVREYRKVVRDEMTRISATALPLQRAIDALSLEVKRWAASDASATAEVGNGVAGLTGRTDELRDRLDALVGETKNATGQLAELASRALLADTQLTRRFAALTDSLREALKANGEQVDARAEAVRTELSELVEELRKKKKGWF
jgi:hypothetical protein